MVYWWFISGLLVAWTTTSQPLIGSNSQEHVPKKGFHKWTPKLRCFTERIWRTAKRRITAPSRLPLEALYANWVHANGGYSQRGCCMQWCKVVCVLCIFARFCVFLCVSVAFFPAKVAPAKKRKFCAESCKNVQKVLLCNTPFSCTPFCVSPSSKKARPKKPQIFQVSEVTLKAGFL